MYKHSPKDRKEMYMISTKKKRILRSALGLACAVTIASVNTSVYASPETQGLEEKTSSLQGELDNLNNELTSLSKELDNTSSQIESLSASIEQAKLDLAAAKLNEEAQYDAMKNRIKFMYEGGNVSLLNILFASEDMADFLNNAEYVSTISDYDRDMLNELENASELVEQKESDLETQQSELSALKEELTGKQSELTAKISSTSGQLADYNAQLERAKAAEAALALAQNNSVSGSVGNSSGSSGGGAINTGNTTPAETSDVALLAAIVQCEASGYDGMLAVATVIMNRVASSRYPNTISGVVYQKGQFSPASSGKLNRVLAQGPSSTAYAVAQDTLAGARHSSVLECYSFRSASSGYSGINIGGNVFF